MVVSDVQPVVNSNTVLKEGTVNEISLDLDVSYLDTSETTDVSGDEIWTTSMWMSSDELGSNVLSGTQVEEVLNPIQRSQDLTKDPSELFTINDISYSADLTGHTCDEAKFFCAKFNKHPDPKLAEDYSGFILEGDPNESVLTGCTEVEACTGKFLVSNCEFAKTIGQVSAHTI